MSNEKNRKEKWKNCWLYYISRNWVMQQRKEFLYCEQPLWDTNNHYTHMHTWLLGFICKSLDSIPLLSVPLCRFLHGGKPNMFKHWCTSKLNGGSQFFRGVVLLIIQNHNLDLGRSRVFLFMCWGSAIGMQNHSIGGMIVWVHAPSLQNRLLVEMFKLMKSNFASKICFFFGYSGLALILGSISEVLEDARDGLTIIDGLHFLASFLVVFPINRLTIWPTACTCFSYCEWEQRNGHILECISTASAPFGYDLRLGRRSHGALGEVVSFSPNNHQS